MRNGQDRCGQELALPVAAEADPLPPAHVRSAHSGPNTVQLFHLRSQRRRHHFIPISRMRKVRFSEVSNLPKISLLEVRVRTQIQASRHEATVRPPECQDLHWEGMSVGHL